MQLSHVATRSHTQPLLKCGHHHNHPRGHRQRIVAGTGAEPLTFDVSKYGNKAILDQAARRYALGLEQGFKEEELIAMELGFASTSALPEALRPYKDKIKDKLAKRAEEIRVEEEALKARLSRNLNLGKEAYECGEYVASVRLLEQAVEDAGPDTNLGGEAQLWLALSYQACGRETDSISLYKQLEASHPSRKVKKQAGDLRYILEAPKLQIDEDERVKIPLLQSDTWRQKERKTFTPKSMIRTSAPEKKSSYWDRDWQAPNPLSIIPDKWYYRVMFASVLVGLTVYLNYAASH